MQISARLSNAHCSHDVTLTTAGDSKKLAIPVKSTGGGSAVNGGEFLMLALATCYCNDLYREAVRLGISIYGAEVEARAHFDGVGLAARNIKYSAHISSDASAEAVAPLIRETDAVAEIPTRCEWVLTLNGSRGVV
jgi:organic hydroperoxide reductase OsmC/OhrA